MIERTHEIISAWVRLLPVVLIIALPPSVRTPTFSREMAAVKAITTVYTAETQYYSQYGQYATSLAQLGPPASGNPGPNGAELIDKDLASGQKAGFRFVLRQTQAGYSLFVDGSGTHTYYSDQSMSIHQHDGREPATVGDPLLGETTLVSLPAPR
jgi:hypothetical protein